MHLNESIKHGISNIRRTLQGNRPASITLSNDHIQSSTQNCTVVLGLHSLRLSVVNNIDNTAVVITPCNVQGDDGENIHNMGTVFHIFNSEEMITKEYNTLNVDGGELFQLGTLYNCDFSDTSEILPLFYRILEDLEGFNVKANASIIPEAKLNISAAMEKYKAMA